MSITDLLSTIHLKDSITFTLNSDFLNHNFDIVRQCLLRIKDIENHLGKSKEHSDQFEHKLKDIESKVKENSVDIHENRQKIKELSNNVGDDFLKKMYAIEAKTQNMFDFDETVRRLEGLNKFVPVESFEEHKIDTSKEFEKVMKIKEEFQRYLPTFAFDRYKEEQQRSLSEKQVQIDEANKQIKALHDVISKIHESVEKVDKDVKENAAMIKEVNFAELADKMRKFKDETEHRVIELAGKMKKKVSVAELAALEKNMVEKLDKFFSDNQKSKAEKQETKQALLFLQKKINEIEGILTQKLSEEDNDALFSSKKLQCASCTKDLGKFQGKLGQYKPWSIFPCKELDPEKTGGFGYLNYIDKMAYRKGYEMDDQNMERLSKSFYDSKEKGTPSRNMNSTRGSNIISNFGTEERGYSLKEAYFRELQSEKGDRLNTSKLFRVTKKEAAKPIEEESKQE